MPHKLYGVVVFCALWNSRQPIIIIITVIIIVIIIIVIIIIIIIIVIIIIIIIFIIVIIIIIIIIRETDPNIPWGEIANWDDNKDSKLIEKCLRSEPDNS